MPIVEALLTGWRRRLPVLLQTEAAECGIACLAMIASYHGHAVDVPALQAALAKQGVYLRSAAAVEAQPA